ncbi:MAG: TIGR03087 family PEP-CTERM/XrtA system glycosyltransferase [Novosphingobium sp.]
MNGEILFLSHRIPFPPNRGDKIRSHHVLCHLAGLAPVHVATLADDAADMAHEPELAALAASHRLVLRRKSLVRSGMEALATGLPVSLAAFHDAALAQYVQQTLADRPIGTIYAFSGQMGQYIPASFKGQVIYDFVDVDSAKFEAYGEAGSGPRAWIDTREGRLLAAEEARLARRADVSLFVSNEEAALFRARLLPQDRLECEVRALRNGIDAALFDPGKVVPAAAMTAAQSPRLIFTGQMDYAPNIEAARRVIERLLPIIRKTCPEASFHVVGRNPPESLKALGGTPGVVIHGAVDDMRSYLAAADLALVPLELARGVQNKVLEAMAMQLPVVLTPEAATGIGGSDGRHYVVADSDEDLARCITDLATDHARRRAIGQAARDFVIEKLSWPATLAPLSDMLGLAETAARDAA